MPERPASPIPLTDAADYLGVSTRTVRRYIASGLVSAFRIGPRKIRLDPAELDRLLQPVPSENEAALLAWINSEDGDDDA